MNTFPAEFADLLDRRGRALLEAGRPLPQFRTARATPLAYFDRFIPRDRASAAVAILDRALYPRLRRVAEPVPPDWRRRQRKNFSESLGKTLRNATASLNARGTSAWRAARDCGLIAMMRSASFRRFAEVVTGHALVPNGRQVICYRHGDFVGPHNDHHPEEAHLRDGFVDVHLMFNNADVKTQTLVYERRGFLSEAVALDRPSGITVYRLPFWHYVSPLVARPGREATARRWLILGSFEIVG